MNETLDELLKHFVSKEIFGNFYITNLTDKTEDYYELNELIDYGHYKVIEWQFDMSENLLLIDIEK